MTKKLSRLLFFLHNKTFFKTLIGKALLKRKDASNSKEINKQAYYLMNYKFDCDRPRTFNEYLCWIKLYYRNNLWATCADKLGSKDFLQKNGFSKYTVKTYKVYKDTSQIVLDELPDKFVLKTNHDCGSVFVCDKKTTDFKLVFKSLDDAMKRKYSDGNGEWVYKNITPLIFAEELLIPKPGSQLIDYKIFAFNGKYGWGFTAQNRNVDTHFMVFEGDYMIQDVEYIALAPKKKDRPARPNDFNEMIRVSENISKLLDFVRVDFYDTIDGIRIGELTFFSQSGLGPFTKKEYDFRYGDCFKQTKLFKQIIKK